MKLTMTEYELHTCTFNVLHTHFRNYLYQYESQLILNLRLLFMNRNNKKVFFSLNSIYACIQSRYLSEAVNSGRGF